MMLFVKYCITTHWLNKHTFRFTLLYFCFSDYLLLRLIPFSLADIPFTVA